MQLAPALSPAQFAPAALSGHIQHIPPDNEAQTAHNDERHGDEIEPHVRGIGDEAVRANKIDTRVAEGGHRVENGQPDAPRTVLRHKHRQAQQRPRALHRQCALEHLAQKPHQPGQGLQIEGTLQQHPVFQADAAADEHHEAGGEGDDAQAAQLYEHENDDVSQCAPVGEGVHAGQAGDAH